MECLLHASGDILHLCRRGEAYREPAARPLSPMDAAWAIEAIPADALGLKADLLRVLEHLQAYFGCTPRTTVAELRTAVVRAIRDGGLVVYRARPPILSGSVVAVAQLPPKETYQEEQPLDMYVIAPELSFLGAGVTPLIQHQVRVLDPETGEVVDVTIDRDAVVAYQKRFQRLSDDLRRFAKRHRASYLRVRTDEPLLLALRRFVARAID